MAVDRHMYIYRFGVRSAGLFVEYPWRRSHRDGLLETVFEADRYV